MRFIRKNCLEIMSSNAEVYQISTGSALLIVIYSDTFPYFLTGLRQICKLIMVYGQPDLSPCLKVQFAESVEYIR